MNRRTLLATLLSSLSLSLAPAQARTYVVRTGDTVSQVALDEIQNRMLAEGISCTVRPLYGSGGLVEQIGRENGLDDVDEIVEDQELHIQDDLSGYCVAGSRITDDPRALVLEIPDGNAVTIVKDGDTLGQIALNRVLNPLREARMAGDVELVPLFPTGEDATRGTSLVERLALENHIADPDRIFPGDEISVPTNLDTLRDLALGLDASILQPGIGLAEVPPEPGDELDAAAITTTVDGDADDDRPRAAETTVEDSRLPFSGALKGALAGSAFGLGLGFLRAVPPQARLATFGLSAMAGLMVGYASDRHHTVARLNAQHAASSGHEVLEAPIQALTGDADATHPLPGDPHTDDLETAIP